MAGKGANSIRLRGGVWWLHKRVPKALAHLHPGTHIRKSLGTGDRREAERRALHVLSDELRRLESLASGPQHPRRLQRQLADLARARDVGEIDSELADELVHVLIEQHTRKLPRASLDEPYGHPRDDRHVAAIRGAVDRYNDPSAAPLSEVAKSYLEEQERRSPSLPKSTVYKMKKALDAFAAYLLPLAGDPPLRQVTRRHAGGYVSELLKNGQAPATNKGRITMLGTFWKWSMLKGYTEATPWAGQVQTLRGSRRGNGSVRRRAFTPDELLALVNAAGPDDRRWHLVVLALYTGCRLEELASTETKDVDVDAGALYLPEGKTESSVRHVPIHSVIAPLVKHLVKASSDGYLLAGLKGRGMDKRRGSYIGDRTNEFIDQAVSDDPGLVVHSLRKNFARALDNAGIPSNIAESLVGHRRQSMTYDAYSGSPEFAVLRAAMANVTYGSEVDDAVRAALSEFDRAA